MESKMPLAKKRKVTADDGKEKVAGPSASALVIQEQEVFTSPNTTPMLFPELWQKILEYLSPEDLKTVLNTCPEWNKLMAEQKTTVLFPEVMECIKTHLRFVDFLPIRLVSKTWNTAANLAVPDIPALVEASASLERAKERIKARIRIGMRWRIRAAHRRAQGLPEEVYNPDELEEPVPDNEISDEQIRRYLRQQLQGLAARQDVGGPPP